MFSGMLLLMLACAPNAFPVARSLAMGPPDHIWGDAAALRLHWEGDSPERAELPWSALGQLELRHLVEGDEIVIHAEGRPITLMRRREGRLDREAALIGSWRPMQVRELGASTYPMAPWVQAGTPQPEPVLSDAGAEEALRALVTHCAAERIARVPNMAGVLEIEAHSSQGELSYIAVHTDTLRDPMLNDCLLRSGLGSPLAAGGTLQVSICQGIRDCG